MARRPLKLLELHLISPVVRVAVAAFPVGPVQLSDQTLHFALENDIVRRLQASGNSLQL